MVCPLTNLLTLAKSSNVSKSFSVVLRIKYEILEMVNSVKKSGFITFFFLNTIFTLIKTLIKLDFLWPHYIQITIPGYPALWILLTMLNQYCTKVDLPYPILSKLIFWH